jgi:hypothetical protein
MSPAPKQESTTRTTTVSEVVGWKMELDERMTRTVVDADEDECGVSDGALIFAVSYRLALRRNADLIIHSCDARIYIQKDMAVGKGVTHFGGSLLRWTKRVPLLHLADEGPDGLETQQKRKSPPSTGTGAKEDNARRRLLLATRSILLTIVPNVTLVTVLVSFH